MINFTKLSPYARIDNPAKKGDAGYDLYNYKNMITIYSHKLTAVSTGICIEIPEGYVGIICEKSGLALNKGVQVMGGIIDSGYRGEIKVIIKNNLSVNLKLNPGDKIAQLLIVPCITPKLKEVKSLNQTEREGDGFGSTG